MGFTELTEKQIENKRHFINQYIGQKNAATASLFDSNANVSSKNIATLEAEINKDINIQINRAMMKDRISSLYGEELANEYIRQLEEHEIYKHDETSLKPYCVSLNMYPFLTHWTTKLWGESKWPNNIYSFAWSFVNLVFATSSQFAGAVATVEFLLYFDHFARREWGEGYTYNLTPQLKKEISQLFQHIVYSINQPASARWYQSVFWNISLFDSNYFESLFGTFVFPNWDKPKWDSLSNLQDFFMEWFNAERTKAVLTFPVVTAAMLVNEDEPVDKGFAEDVSRWLSEWNSFFVYQSKSVDSLASCCRLRNEMSDNTFSYSLGAGGVATWSISVITINYNRLIQKNYSIKEQIDKIHKYQLAYRSIVKDFLDAWMLPVYDAWMITLDKQFLTIGINWMVEAAEFLWIKVGNNDEYKKFVQDNLKIIYDTNKEIKASSWVMFNTEFVPAENLWVKNAKWDKAMWLSVSRDCYNSYFYVVEDEETTIIDKFVLHWREVCQFLDGGSALHLNLEEHLTKENYLNLLKIAAHTWCNYFTTNVKITICNECNNIDKRTLQLCPKCASRNIDYWTRVIWYLKRISSFSDWRQKEACVRNYHITNQ